MPQNHYYSRILIQQATREHSYSRILTKRPSWLARGCFLAASACLLAASWLPPGCLLAASGCLLPALLLVARCLLVAYSRLCFRTAAAAAQKHSHSRILIQQATREHSYSRILTKRPSWLARGCLVASGCLLPASWLPPGCLLAAWLPPGFRGSAAAGPGSEAWIQNIQQFAKSNARIENTKKKTSAERGESLGRN
jgi:negative regulator of sigma E activity